MTPVVFLTRRGCSLCEEAEPKVRAAARWLRLEVRSVDVDVEAAALADRYGERVPVVLAPGGREIASGRFGFGRLLWLLLRARAADD
jgi:hypothetical protein